MSADLVHIRQVMAEADCLFTNAQVEAAIDQVAAAIKEADAPAALWVSDADAKKSWGKNRAELLKRAEGAA